MAKSKWPSAKQQALLAAAEKFGRELEQMSLPLGFSWPALDRFSSAASKAGVRTLLVVVDEQRALGLRVEDLRALFQARGIWNVKAALRRKDASVHLDEQGLHVWWATGRVRFGVVCVPSGKDRNWKEWQERSLVLSFRRRKCA